MLFKRKKHVRCKLQIVMQAFKNAMSKVPSSVSILSVQTENSHISCTISSLISVEVETPRVLFVLRKDSSTLKAILLHKTFSINVLSYDQEALAVKYSANQRIFEPQDWVEGLSQTLDLKGSWLHFACEFDEVLECGSSVVVISRVIGHKFTETGKPLIYINRSYLTLTQEFF